MNATTHPDVREIVFMKPARFGGTESVILNHLGRSIHIEPGPAQVTQPTNKLGQRFAERLFDHMVRDTPVLHGKVYGIGVDPTTGSGRREKGNKILAKSGPGWSLEITGANTPNAFVQATIKYMYLDEVDRYKLSVGVEGDPISLARERCEGSFADYKLIMISSPTVEGASLITDEYLRSNRSHFFVPCPSCGEPRVILFSDKSYFRKDDYGHQLPAMFVKYDSAAFNPNSLDSVWLECETCGGKMTERMKYEWIPKGEWIAERPAITSEVGYHLNQFYSLFPSLRWGRIVKSFLNAKRNREKLQVFVNTKLAEPFQREESISLRSSALLNLTESYPEPANENEVHVPEPVAALIATVDQQDDRLEIAVTGFGPTKDESWLIAYETIDGSPEYAQTWQDAADYIDNTIFRHASGVSLRPVRELYDTHGHFSEECYKWIRTRRALRHHAFGIRGAGGDDKKFIQALSRKNSQGIPLYTLGVDEGKNKMTSRVTQMRRWINESKLHPDKPRPLGWMHFPRHICDEDWFGKFFSEKRIREKNKYGIYGYRWVPKEDGIRNEPWDLWNYALAGMEIWRGSLRKEAVKIKQKAAELKTREERGGGKQTENTAPTSPRRRRRIIRRR